MRELLDDINGAVSLKVDFLKDGGPKTYDAYRYLCGEIYGLRLAEGMIIDYMKKMEAGDDD